MNDLLEGRRGKAIAVAAVVIVFLALRIALLWARDPFFDELFTLWIAQKPFGGILQALTHDSGPPLFYFVVRALALRSVDAIRIVSLAASAITLSMILAARPLGNARFVAAALLAVYPPAVLFAVDARAYALCAMFATAGLIALRSGRPYPAALAFVAAAYSHYYGALFFPLLLLSVHEQPDDAEPTFNFQFSIFNFRSLLAFLTAIALFIPGLLLAFHQPREAMQWLHEPRIAWIQNLSFAGRYPYALFPPAQRWLVALAAMLLVAAIAGPALIRTSRRPFVVFAALATIVPLAIAVTAGVYFPMRFESVVAVPLALWIASSVEAWSIAIRGPLIAALLVIGFVVSSAGIADHANRPIDPYRAAALWTAGHVRPSDTVVASGYCYLEAATNVHARLIAMPEEQAVHPGWRAFPTPATRIPDGGFIWIGERAAPELSILRNARSIKPLYANDRAIVAAVR